MNELTKKIKMHVAYLEATHVNDPKIDIILDEVEEFLLKDLKITIEVLNELDLLSIEWVCSRFEKISYNLQNKEFIECVEGLLVKFAPGINGFKNEVQEAKEAYYGN